MSIRSDLSWLRARLGPEQFVGCPVCVGVVFPTPMIRYPKDIADVERQTPRCPKCGRTNDGVRAIILRRCPTVPEGD